MNKKTYLTFGVIVCALLSSCHNDPPVVAQPEKVQNVDYRDYMSRANKINIDSEETQIQGYISRHGWPMQELTFGTRIWIYEAGDGEAVTELDSVNVIYNVEAIDGKVIYENVTESFMAGRRQTMKGLDEAVLNMHHGDHAKVILPSSMGYSVGGDGDRIPRGATLILDVKVLK